MITLDTRNLENKGGMETLTNGLNHITGDVFRRVFTKAYTTRPSSEIEKMAYERYQAKPGFPYVSFRHAESLKLIYALKLAHRDSLTTAIFESPRRPEFEAIVSNNRRMRVLRDKGYVNVYKVGRPASHCFSLTDLAFQYLRRNPYNTEFTPERMQQLLAVNTGFTELCREYRETHFLEWETEPVVELDGGENVWKPSAVSVVWKNRTKTEAEQAFIYETPKSVFLNDQLAEAERLADFYSQTDVWKYFPVTPDLVLVNKENHKKLTLFHNKERVATSEDIRAWLGI